eukprot:CAMPEP_0170748020 /NCGR_PEP_ID=MMETSP0437-20130122/9627_1 /TAXON_ID=0 /ORGANISM="Sexangularia sp." /LENGTH=289 /DNA_ID=CAMNT_0011086825 /DNA_START=229 /DNA_END=1098 /DNA_ORIENTATION=-
MNGAPTGEHLYGVPQGESVGANDSVSHPGRWRNPRRIWTEEEDAIIRDWVARHGPARWTTLARYLDHRNGKQAREHWVNCLDPSIVRSGWTVDEDITLVRWQQQHGNSWAGLTKILRGRTSNAVKNHWHSSLRAPRSRLARLVSGEIDFTDPVQVEKMRQDEEARIAESGKARGVGDGEGSGSLGTTDAVFGDVSFDRMPSLLQSPAESARSSADVSPLTSASNSTTTMSGSRKRTLTDSTEVPLRARRRLSPTQAETDATTVSAVTNTTQEDADAVNLFLSVVTAIRE